MANLSWLDAEFGSLQLNKFEVLVVELLYLSRCNHEWAVWRVVSTAVGPR